MCDHEWKYKRRGFYAWSTSEGQAGEDCCWEFGPFGYHAHIWFGHGPFHRHFRTRAEQIAELEAYLKELEAEVQAVKERIEELRKTQ